MVKVSIEVRNGSARFSVAVRSESIWRAMSIVGGRYPDDDLRAKFPIDPGGFFVNDPAAQARTVQSKQPHSVTA